MKFDFYLLITSINILLLQYYNIFPGFSRIQLKKLNCMVDRGILWKLEVAVGQQKSSKAWPILTFIGLW
jgi:hypothetical protein